jgi:hypothetical protein
MTLNCRGGTGFIVSHAEPAGREDPDVGCQPFRLDLGAQGPPADELIERLTAALEAKPDELLRAAGRAAGGQSFEEAILTRLDGYWRDVREVKAVVSRKSPPS